MEKKNVLIGVANQSEQSMKIEDIKNWEPTKVSYVSNTAYFKVDDIFYSMVKSEFIELFGHQLKG
jgi:predicted transcriptional regulator